MAPSMNKYAVTKMVSMDEYISNTEDEILFGRNLKKKNVAIAYNSVNYYSSPEKRERFGKLGTTTQLYINLNTNKKRRKVKWVLDEIVRCKKEQIKFTGRTNRNREGRPASIDKGIVEE